MIEQSQTHFKCLKAFVIGGEPKDRAPICYAAASDQLAIKPLGSIDELTPPDLVSGDAYIVCDKQSLRINSNILEVNFMGRSKGEPMTARPSRPSVLLLKVTPSGVLEGLMN